MLKNVMIVAGEASGDMYGARVVEEIAVPQRDQILAEIEAFIDSIQTGKPAVVSGQDGMKALEIALLIEEKILENIALLRAGV